MALTPLDGVVPQTPQSDAQPAYNFPENSVRAKIVAAAQKYGVDPGLMVGLAEGESGFRQIANIQSAKRHGVDPMKADPATFPGAYGIFQFEPTTAKKYGVDRGSVDSQVDGAARYMSDLLEQTNGDAGKAIALYKGVSVGGAPESAIPDTLNRARKYGYGGSAPQDAPQSVPRGTSQQAPAPQQNASPDIASIYNPDGSIRQLTPDDVRKMAASGNAPATQAPVSNEEYLQQARARSEEDARNDIFSGVSTQTSTSNAPGSTLAKLATPAAEYIGLAPKQSDASGMGVIGRPATKTGLSFLDAKPKTTGESIQESPPTSIWDEPGRVLMQIAGGPAKAIARMTGMPVAGRDAALEPEEQQRLKELGLPDQPIPGMAGEQKEATRLNPDNPQDAERLSQIRAHALTSGVALQQPGTPAEDLKNTGVEPQTAAGRTIGSTGQAITQFLTEAATAKALGVPEATGLNTFGSAALVGGARPTLAGEESPLQLAAEVGTGELLGNAMKLPTAAQRFVAGAGVTGGQNVLQTVASGRQLNAGDIASQAAQGGLMTVGGEPKGAEEGAPEAKPTPYRYRSGEAANAPVEPTANAEPPVAEPTQPVTPEKPAPRVGEEIRVAAGKLPVTVAAPKGSTVQLDQEAQDLGRPESYTPDHTVGVIDSIGQSVDKPIVTLVGDEKVGKKVFVADLYEDGKFAGHNVIAQVDDPVKAIDMLRQNYGDDVANNAVIHETTQHPVRTWLEQGDLDKPFGEQADDIREKAGGSSNFVRVDKIDTEALRKNAQTTPENTETAQPAAVQEVPVEGEPQPTPTSERYSPIPPGTQTFKAYSKVDLGASYDADGYHYESRGKSKDGKKYVYEPVAITSEGAESIQRNKDAVANKYEAWGLPNAAELARKDPSAALEQHEDDVVGKAFDLADQKLTDAGYTLNYTSESGSRYYDKDIDGKNHRIRVADHVVPDSLLRAEGSKGGADDEIIVKGQHTIRPRSDVERDINSVIEQNDATAQGNGQRNNLEEHTGNDGIVGENRNDRQSEDIRPEESPRSGGGGSSPQREGLTPEPVPTAEATEPPPEIIGPRKTLVDEQRERLGMPSIAPHVPEEIMSSYRNADEAIRDGVLHGVDVGGDLVQRLLKSPKTPVSDTDVGVLANELIARSTARDAVAERAARETDPEKAAQLRATLRQNDAALDDVHQVLRSGGSLLSRGMNALRAVSERLDDGSYTRPRIEERILAAKGGEPLTDADRAQAKDFSEKIDAARRDSEAKATENVKENADSYIQELAKAMTREAKESATKGKSVVDYFNDREAKALARIKARNASPRLFDVTGATISAISEARDYAEIGAAHMARGLRDFGEWGKAMVDKLGPQIAPRLHDIYKAAQDLYDAHKGFFQGKETLSHEDALADAKTNAEAGNRPSPKVIENLARAHIADGAPLDEVMGRVHADLQEAHPGISEREVGDIWTRYGQTRYPSQDAIEKGVREVRGARRLTSQLEDAIKGEAPKRTGLQRDKPSQWIRDKMKEVSRTVRAMGIEVTSPEKQLATSLDAVKTRLRNSIEDLERRLSTGEKPPAKKPIEYDQEATTLRARADDLRKQIGELEGTTGLTQEERVDRAMEATKRSIEMYDDLLKRGAQRPVREPVAETPELKDLRTQRDALRQTYEQVNHVAIDRYKNALDNRQTELNRRLAEKDFGPRSKTTMPTDNDAVAKRQRLELTKKMLDSAIEQHRIENLQGMQKFWYNFQRVRRATLLTALTALGKISAFGVSGLISSAIDEAVGGAMGKLPLIGRVSKASPFEGGFSLKAEAKAMAGIWTGIVRDAPLHLQNKRTAFETQYDIKKALGKPDWLDYPGAVHAALKDPLKVNHFERMMQKGLESAIRRGENIDGSTQEGVMRVMAITAKAAELARGKILMGDNRLVGFWSRNVGRLTRSEHMGERIAGRVVLGEEPIAKVPVNFAALTIRRTTGWASGSAMLLGKGAKGAWDSYFGGEHNAMEAAKSFAAALDNMDPDDADLIMRHLKQGWMGPAVALMGYLNPGYLQSLFGGYHQQNERRDPGDVPANQIKDVAPMAARAILHTEFGEQLQLYATMRRVSDGMFAGDMISGTPKGLPSGAIAAALGLVKDLPMLDFFNNMAKIADGGTAEVQSAMSNYAVSFAVPGALQNVAQALDQNTARKPEGIIDQVKMGIPGLRQQVPEKPENVKDAITLAVRSNDAKTAVALKNKVAMPDKPFRHLVARAAMPPFAAHFMSVFSGPKKSQEALAAFERASPKQKSVIKPFLVSKIRAIDKSVRAGTTTLTPEQVTDIKQLVKEEAVVK